jgi:hypothetical protein
MEAKEKAKELINKYNFLNYKTDLSIHEKKQCALIAVDEILKALESDWSFMEIRQEYWQEVKQEILKL